MLVVLFKVCNSEPTTQTHIHTVHLLSGHLILLLVLRMCLNKLYWAPLMACLDHWPPSLICISYLNVSVKVSRVLTSSPTIQNINNFCVKTFRAILERTDTAVLSLIEWGLWFLVAGWQAGRPIVGQQERHCPSLYYRACHLRRFVSDLRLPQACNFPRPPTPRRSPIQWLASSFRNFSHKDPTTTKPSSEQ